MATQPAVWESERKVPSPQRSPRLARPGAGPRAHRWRGSLRGRAARLPESDKRNLLVSLFPLVKRLAAEMRSHLPVFVELDDLVGAGALGLVDAVDKFDLSKHVKLETYARHRIRGSILDSLRALDPASRGMRRKKREIEKLYRELGNRLGRHVSDEEMAEALGVDLAAWYGILEEFQAVGNDGELGRWSRRPARVGPRTAWYGAGADGDGMEIPDPQAGPCELLLRREQREILDRALASLPERDRAVMTLYYRQELTMQKIATRLGVDESRISQIHAQALACLRRRVQALLCPSADGRVGALRHQRDPSPESTGPGDSRPSATALGRRLPRAVRPLPRREAEGEACLDLIPGSRSGSLSAIGSLSH